VITVDAMKDEHTVSRADDLIASYSSKGPTLFDHVVKPDIVAPGWSRFQRGRLPLTGPDRNRLEQSAGIGMPGPLEQQLDRLVFHDAATGKYRQPVANRGQRQQVVRNEALPCSSHDQAPAEGREDPPE
jgi:hypothetical protein